MNRSTNKNHIAHITKTTGPYKSHIPRKKKRITDVMNPHYEGENETYIEASAENSGSILYDKEIRDKPRTRRTKRNV